MRTWRAGVVAARYIRTFMRLAPIVLLLIFGMLGCKSTSPRSRRNVGCNRSVSQGWPPEFQKAVAKIVVNPMDIRCL